MHLSHHLRDLLRIINVAFSAIQDTESSVDRIDCDLMGCPAKNLFVRFPSFHSLSNRNLAVHARWRLTHP
jgi:hypothetical protein